MAISMSTPTSIPSPYAVDNSNCSRPSSCRPRGVLCPLIDQALLRLHPPCCVRISPIGEGKRLLLFWLAPLHPLIGPGPSPPRDNPPLRLAACETSDACCGVECTYMPCSLLLLWSSLAMSCCCMITETKKHEHGRCDGHVRDRMFPELNPRPAEPSPHARRTQM